MPTTRMQKINTQVLYQNMHTGLGDLLSQSEENDEVHNCSPLDFSNPDCRYQNPQLLGSGGMKHVYSVQDSLTGRKVAMAVLKNIRCANDLKLFLDEAKVTSKLEHPNIIPIYDMGNDDKGEPFFTMKLMSGETLADSLRRESPSKSQNKIQILNDKLNIFLKICDAIAFAHSQDILHLDLKPENIQIGDYGEVLVIDWGLAFHLFNDSLDEDQRRLCGTPGFIAPELKKSKTFSPDHRCDIYSLGVVLRCLLSLTGPLDKAFYTNPENIPASLIAIANKAMHDDPELRYQSVDQVSRDIKRHLNGFATLAEDASQRTLLMLFCRRNIKTILSCCAFALILSIVLHYMQDNAALSNKVKRVQEHQLLITEMNSEELLASSAIRLKALNTDQAELFINQALILDPKNPQLILQCASIHFVDFHFLAAHQKFKSLGSTFDRMTELSLKAYSQSFTSLSTNEMSEIIDFFYEHRAFDVANNFFLRIRDLISEKQALTLFDKYLRKFNSGIHSLEFNRPNSLVITGDKELNQTGPLLLLNLKVLDISKIGSQEVHIFDHMNLSSLHLDPLTLKRFAQEPAIPQVFINNTAVVF